MLNSANGFRRYCCRVDLWRFACGFNIPMSLRQGFKRIVEMVRRVTKGINLEILQQLSRHLIEQPVNDQASLNPTLAVKNEDHFLVLRIQQVFLDDRVRNPHVRGGVGKVPLN